MTRLMLRSAVVLCVLVCSTVVSIAEPSDAVVVDVRAAKRALFEATPSARLFEDRGRTTDAYGAPMALGTPPTDSAEVRLRFSEPVRDVGGLALTAASFDVVGTGATHPTVAAVDASANPLVVLTLSGPIPVLEWTTVTATVEDLSGNVMESAGDLGPGVDEGDRVDIGFLPGDVDQNGSVQPFDLLMFRGIINGINSNPQGDDADFVDIDRNGTISPFDLLAFRQLINGTGNATRVWADQSLPPRP